MVHYNPSLKTAQTPPPLCPKCGSHRTEVIGKSDDGTSLIIRCNACGERSEVSQKHQSGADGVEVEVEVMAQVGRALSSLPDAGSRARVRRWAMERHQQVEAAPPALAPALRTAPAAADPSLAVEIFNDLFLVPDLSRPAQEDDVPAPEPAAHASGIESMVRRFAADFRRLALEWQGA